MAQDCRSCGNGDASWCTDCLDMFKQAWGDRRYKAGLQRAIEMAEQRVAYCREQFLALCSDEWASRGHEAVCIEKQLRAELEAGEGGER